MNAKLKFFRPYSAIFFLLIGLISYSPAARAEVFASTLNVILKQSLGFSLTRAAERTIFAPHSAVINEAVVYGSAAVFMTFTNPMKDASLGLSDPALGLAVSSEDLKFFAIENRFGIGSKIRKDSTADMAEIERSIADMILHYSFGKKSPSGSSIPSIFNGKRAPREYGDKSIDHQMMNTLFILQSIATAPYYAISRNSDITEEAFLERAYLAACRGIAMVDNASDPSNPYFAVTDSTVEIDELFHRLKEMVVDGKDGIGIGPYYFLMTSSLIQRLQKPVFYIYKYLDEMLRSRMGKVSLDTVIRIERLQERFGLASSQNGFNKKLGYDAWLMKKSQRASRPPQVSDLSSKIEIFGEF